MGRVLVTDASRPSALAVIRSLGRRGHFVVAADSTSRTLGSSSRYASARVRYPPPAERPAELVEALAEAASAEEVDLVIPVTDAVIVPLDRARARFARVCKLALPAPAALAAARDKEATRVLAARLGIPVPKTALVATVEAARDEAAELGWPIVLKPRSSVARAGRSGRELLDSFRVSYANDLDSLARQVSELEGRCEVLLQEYCHGEGHGVELLLHEGRPLAAFQHRRLREVPITGGASSSRESVELDPQLYEYALRLLSSLRWTGLAMVEFKVGRSGPHLMEVNGRIWGSLPLAVKSGLDFPARLAELYLDGPPAPNGGPDTTYRRGVRSRQLDLEVVWIASVLRRKRRYPFLEAPPRRQGLAAAARLLDPADGIDSFSRDDIRPGLLDVAQVVAKLGRKAARGR